MWKAIIRTETSSNEWVFRKGIKVPRNTFGERSAYRVPANLRIYPNRRNDRPAVMRIEDETVRMYCRDFLT